MSATLEVEIEEGRGFPHPPFGRHDNCVVVKLGRLQEVTSASGGSNPRYNSTFTFPFNDEADLRLEIINTKHQHVGTGHLDLRRIQKMLTISGSVDCKSDRGKTVGTIELTVKYKGTQAAQCGDTNRHRSDNSPGWGTPLPFPSPPGMPDFPEDFCSNPTFCGRPPYPTHQVIYPPFPEDDVPPSPRHGQHNRYREY